VLSSGSRLRWPLIGRVHELQQISLARQQGANGVVLAGPAGVGKSRLAREALAASKPTASTLWIQATRSAASVPLGALAGVIPLQARSEDPLEMMQLSTRALADSAGAKDLVLGVDDAHLLDPASAALILDLAITGVAFVVATVRVGEVWPDAITSLWKDDDVDRLDLQTLSEADADRLVEAIVGGPVEQAARTWIGQTSQGNALYIRELILGALAGGALTEVSGLWRMPARPAVSASLSEIVTVRLAGLSGPERDALEMLALGEPLRLYEILELTGSEPVRSLEDRGLIDIDSGHPDAEAKLAHPLYGEIIRAFLPPLRARETCIQLAGALQRRSSPQAQDPLRIARWLLDAGEPMPIPLLMQAAKTANASGDPGLATELATRALEADAGIQATLVLARAHTLQDQYQQAELVLSNAEPLLDDQETALEYLQQRADVLQWGLKQTTSLQQLLSRAEQWWADHGWQTRLIPLRLRIASLEGSANTAATAAQILASPDLDAEVRRQVMPLYIGNLFYSGRGLQAYGLARETRPSPPLRDLTDELAFVIWGAIALEIGEGWPELENWATAAVQQGVRLGDRAAAGSGALTLGGLRFSQGRFRDASRWLAEAELQLEHHNSAGLLAITNSMQVGVACFTGNAAAIQPALHRCLTSLGNHDPLPNQLPYVIRARAWATAAGGDLSAAQHMLLEAAEQLSTMPIHAARLTYEAMRAGAPARRLAPSLAGLRDRCDARLVAAYAHHAAARDTDDGKELLNVADMMEQIGALRYATEAAAHAADAFTRQHRDDSARRAAARSRDLHDRGQNGLPPPMAEFDDTTIELTPRETQLAQLAATGLSNAQIADRLVLSIRTVESHLYRAMQKRGISDRRDL
jgi:DNA-binding CsgD family transcriptional regulator